MNLIKLSISSWFEFVLFYLGVHKAEAGLELVILLLPSLEFLCWFSIWIIFLKVGALY